MIEASQKGRVLHLALNRPDKRNALTASLCRALVEAFVQANADPSIGAIVLSGNGPSFCAGMDLKEALDTDGDQLAGIHERLFTVLAWTKKPILAAVHGAAAGGGTGLAASTHIVIAAPDARFGLTEIKIALWPVLIFPAMVKALGERKALELSITGRFFDAAEAKQYGLVSEINEDPKQRALQLAAEISSYSAHALSKGLDYSRGLQSGRETRAQLMSHPDFQRAVQAFFTRKRAD